MNIITPIAFITTALLLSACGPNTHAHVEHHSPVDRSSQCSDAQYRIVRQRGKPEEVEVDNYSHVNITTYFYWTQDYSVDFEWNGHRCTVKHYYHQPEY